MWLAPRYRRGRYGWDSCFGFWALGFGLGVQGFCGKGSFRGTGFWCLGSGHRASRIKGLWLRVGGEGLWGSAGLEV